MARERWRMTKILPWALVGIILLPAGASQPPSAPALGAEAMAQMQALLAAKNARSASERKMSFALLSAVHQRKGMAIPGLGRLRSATQPDADGRVAVDVRGILNGTLVSLIKGAGGEIVYGSREVLRVRIPLDRVERLAASGLVRSIRPSAKAMLADEHAGASVHETRPRIRPGFEDRAAI